MKTKIVCLLTFSLSLIYSYSSYAQDGALIKEISLNSSKKFVEDFVVERMKTYFVYNVDNIWKTIRKKQNINLKKQSQRDIFLKDLEILIRTQFQQHDQLSQVHLWDNYNIDITEIIGRDATFSNFKPYTGTCGAGRFNIGFHNNDIAFMSFHIITAKEFSRYSGYEYTADNSQKLLTLYRKNAPNVKLNSYRFPLSYCSDQGEIEYRENFKMNIGNIAFSYTWIFGPYIRQNNSYNCTYLGNHLTEIEVSISVTD